MPIYIRLITIYPHFGSKQFRTKSILQRGNFAEQESDPELLEVFLTTRQPSDARMKKYAG
jgi:hypothetical protein